jgi:hypothetical protein
VTVFLFVVIWTFFFVLIAEQNSIAMRSVMRSVMESLTESLMGSLMGSLTEMKEVSGSEEPSCYGDCRGTVWTDLFGAFCFVHGLRMTFCWSRMTFCWSKSVFSVGVCCETSVSCAKHFFA